MGRYLKLAREALAELDDGNVGALRQGSGHSDCLKSASVDHLRYDINDINDQRQAEAGHSEDPGSEYANAPPYDINDINDQSRLEADLRLQSARRRAEELGILQLGKLRVTDIVKPIVDDAPSVAWVTGPELEELKESLRSLVGPRPGWTPDHWRDDLLRRSAVCDEQHQDSARLYAQAAEILSGTAKQVDADAPPDCQMTETRNKISADADTNTQSPGENGFVSTSTGESDREVIEL